MLTVVMIILYWWVDLYETIGLIYAVVHELLPVNSCIPGVPKRNLASYIMQKTFVLLKSFIYET